MVLHSSVNSIRKCWCTLFPAFGTGSRKIVHHLIISPFSSLLRVRVFKSYVRPNRKSENGLKMINVILPSFHTNTNEMPNHFILLFLLRKG